MMTIKIEILTADKKNVITTLHSRKELDIYLLAHTDITSDRIRVNDVTDIVSSMSDIRTTLNTLEQLNRSSDSNYDERTSRMTMQSMFSKMFSER